MRLFLSLDGPALAHVNSKALCVLHRQSELKIRDVKDIFTRFKKKPAEEIIAHLLGEQYKAGRYFRRLLPDSPKKKNNIKCHEVWFAHTKRGGRDSDNFRAFMNSPFTTYDFSYPPGKKSAPTKPAEKTSASTYTSKSMQQAQQAVIQHKEMVQALSEAATMITTLQAKQKATERLGRQIHFEKSVSDAKVVEWQEVAGETQSKLRQEKAAHRQTKVDGVENVRMIREHGVELQRRDTELARVMRRAGNREQAAQKGVQREQLKRKAAEERVQESRETVRKEKKQRGKVERENKQLAKKVAVLAALPFVAVAAAHAEANAADRKREKAVEQQQKEVEQRQRIERKAKEMAGKMLKSQSLVQVLTGEKRKHLNRDEREVRKKAKEYYQDTQRRDKDREQQAAIVGAFDDIVHERDEYLEQRDYYKTKSVQLQQKVDQLQGELDAAITRVDNKQALVNTIQAKFAKVGIMQKVGRTYAPEYRLLLMSLVGNCSSVYQARTMCRFMVKYACGWMVEGKDYQVPELSFLKDCRRDIAPMTETLAALKVALCTRIVQMGHDGSSIGGADTFTISLKIFTRKEGGGRVLGTGEEEGKYEDISMIASGLPAGKSAQEEVDFMNQTFERGREKIQHLRDQVTKDGKNPDDYLPEAKECTLAKLVGGSLMNDTCNCARSTATKLKACLAAHAKEYYGEAAWEEMSPEVRQSKSYCVDLLCWAHLRNLFIGEGAKHERAYLKEKLKVSESSGE
jgi:hypothetical protein